MSAGEDPSSAWATLTPNGGVDGGGALRLYADGPRGNVQLKLLRGTQELATGTVQVAEFHKVDEPLSLCTDDARAHSYTSGGGKLFETRPPPLHP